MLSWLKLIKSTTSQLLTIPPNFATLLVVLALGSGFLFSSLTARSVQAGTCPGSCAPSCGNDGSHIEYPAGIESCNQGDTCCIPVGSCPGVCRFTCEVDEKLYSKENPCSSHMGQVCCVTKDPVGGAGKPVTSEVLDSFNPLKTEGSAAAEELSTPAGIVSRFLGQFAFPLAGLILFLMLLWGGFEMLIGPASKKSFDAGKQRVTAAIIGFLILFASYWIAQVLEAVLDVQIL